MRGIQRGISTLIILIIFLIGGVAIVSAFLIFQNQQKLKSINSFEDCAKYYPVMESYPGQCNTPDGQHFVQELSEEEKKNLLPPIASPTPKCPEFTPRIEKSQAEGSMIYYGKTFSDPCNPTFSIEFPSSWLLEESHLYPFGEKGINEARINLAANAHGWPDDLKIGTKSFEGLTGSYSWGIPEGQDFAIGFANIGDGKDSVLIEAANIPKEKSLEYETIFQTMLKTVKFYDDSGSKN